MSLPPDHEALRTRVAFSRTGETQVLSLRGDRARDAALHLVPSRLALRDAQARQSLFLDETARPIADVTIAADDESYLLFVDGMTKDALRAHVESALPEARRPEIVDLGETHDVISVHGPWAWELVAEVLGPDMTALPYLNFFRIDEGLCLRSGKTGEFGYDVVCRNEKSEGVLQRLLEKGAAYELREIDASTLSLARFESWFFDPAFVPTGATPLELQLQWRLERGRDFLGRDALEARREAGVARVLACVTSASELRAGSSVTVDGTELGTLVRTAFSHARGAWIGSALLPLSHAHGGLTLASGDAVLRTTAPPLLDNHSLHIDPRRHSFQARDEVKLGPLLRPPLPLDEILRQAAIAAGVAVP